VPRLELQVEVAAELSLLPVAQRADTINRQPRASAMKQKQRRRNPVARNAGRFNRAATFRDRTRYARHSKHKGREPFAVAA